MKSRRYGAERSHFSNFPRRMPFTLSHAAAALPLLRSSKAIGWRPALVFGTMAPDLLYPVPYFGVRSFTHSWHGFLAVDVPFAVYLALVWVVVIAPRISHMPGLSSLSKVDPSRVSLPWILLGAILGVATHLTWDLFTHYGSPVMSPGWFKPLLGNGRLYSTPQAISWYGSTLLGMAVVVWWIRKGFHRQSIGLRRAFLSGPWLRVYAAFLVPYAILLVPILRNPPQRPGQFFWLLSTLVTEVRLAIFASFALALFAIWLQSRRPRIVSD